MVDEKENKFQEILDVSRVCINEDADWDERNDRLVEAVMLSLSQPAPAMKQIRKILKEGVNINATNTDGRTVLAIAKYHECGYSFVTTLTHASEEGEGSADGSTSTDYSLVITPVKIDFQGTASEYFRIWIVNICLTILTLGVYSAWAKVRRNQYFYANTIIDGSSLQYQASLCRS